MPVNTSSTGATYGKSSDPLCPLGFHPQVRWPTRCKRCFRDYKEHSDSGDQKKFANLDASTTESDPWSVRKGNFQKSKSVDVTIESGSSAASRFASYTTSKDTVATSKTEEDIPEWKKAMLERRRKDKEREEEEQKARNFGFIPGTTLHSSYVNKSYDNDARLTSWGSASNLRSSSSYTNLTKTEEPDSSSSAGNNSYSYRNSTPTSSSWRASAEPKQPEPELSPYEKYLQRKREQDKKEEEENKKKEEARREEEKKQERERVRRREEEKRKEEEAEKERQRQREKEREEKRRKEEEEEKAKKAKEEEAKKKATAAPKWGAAASKSTTPTPEKPKWGSSSTTAAVDEVPKRKPWEKPSAAAKSTLPSLNESATASKSKVTFNDKSRKTSESDSDSASVSMSKSKSNHLSDGESDGLKKEVESLKNELRAVKSRNEVLEHMQSEAIKKTPLTLESAKASEATAELMKAREKIRDLDSQLSTKDKDRKALNLKIKELESEIERRPQASETQKTISELQTKLKYTERKCSELNTENEELRGNVQNLEVELEEVQDNFREDEADEYRTLKRELENSAKNCRVLQFKLKKTEKSLSDLQQDNQELESKMKSVSGGSSAIDNINKIRQLEKDLEAKTQQISRLETEMKSSKSGSGPRKGGPGPCLSRTGSVERNVEDQLLKDLQDSIERENDLKEQLSLAEEESAEVRKKMSRIEDENEALSSQLKKMATKNKRRSPSPYNRNSFSEKDEGISEDGEELSPSELKVQLEVSEQETELLRKKVENLLTDNLKLTKEVKDITTKMNDAKKAPASRSYGYGSSSSSNSNEKKIEELQTEVNSFRVKLIEKDREIERLDAQVKSSKTAGGKTLKRGGSQDEDLLSKLAVIEKEAEVLRSKTHQLESENESLKSASKGRPGAAFSQNEKFSLEQKIKELETKLKESNKKITELEDSSKGSMRTNLELDRIKRDKSSMEAEVVKLKDQASAEKRKCEKMERDMVGLSDKVEKAQREVIGVEREKRRMEEEKNKMESQVSRLEGDLRSVTREKDRYKDEAEAARQKNRENLSQTQEGMKAFKDQIESLKQELQDEKRSSRELKRQVEDKTRSADSEASNLRRDIDKQTTELDERRRKVRELEDKIADIEEKWAKSKRINQQRKDKIDKLEQELESASKMSGDSPALQEAEKKVKDLEKQLQSKGGSSWEMTKLNNELTSLKKEKADLQKKHENLEEDFVVLKAKLTMEKDEMSSSIQDDYHTIKGELVALRQTYNDKSDEWIKQKLDLEKQVKDLESAIKSSAGNGWDAERLRFKSILEDRDNQITNLKIECDVARSQHGAAQKEKEDLKQKLQDYEKMSRYGRSVANTSGSDSNGEVEDLKKQLAASEKENKSSVNNIKMKYDSKIAIMTEEIHALKSQSSKYRRERETYKEMFEGVQKKLTDTKAGKLAPGDAAAELSDARNKLSDMTYQIHVLEDELADSKMESAKAQANMMAQKSNFEIQVAELNSKINELEEESLIDSGRARIAGTRTKMELAWQKERESQKKLINELNTMNRDLKSTLLELEKEKERERLDSKRKVEAMKRAFEDEHEDTKKQITDLQYDLLELRDAHAKLRTTNEKLRRDQSKGDDVRSVSVSLYF